MRCQMTTAVSDGGFEHGRLAVALHPPTHPDVASSYCMMRRSGGPRAAGAGSPSHGGRHRPLPTTRIDTPVDTSRDDVSATGKPAVGNAGRYQLKKREVSTRSRLVNSGEFSLTSRGSAQRAILLCYLPSEEASDTSSAHEAASSGSNSAPPKDRWEPRTRGPRTLRGVEWGRGGIVCHPQAAWRIRTRVSLQS